MNRRSYSIGVVVGLVVAAGAIVFAVSREPDDDAVSEASRLVLQTRGYCNGEAQEVSLDRAEKKAPFSLLVPDHALANSNGLDRVLVCPAAVLGTGRAAARLEYSSGVIVIEEWNSIRDPEVTYRSLADEPGISLATVHGHVAIVGEISEERRALGAVEWVEGPRRVSILGNGSIDPAVLLAVAESTRTA